MLNKRVEGFYRGIKPRGEAEWVYTPIKTRPASLLNDFKNIKKKHYKTLKACLKGVDNNDAFVNVGNKHTKKTLRIKLLRKRIKSRTCLEIFQSTNDTD